MVCPSPENLDFLKDKKPFVLHSFRPKRSSKKKKLLLDTNDARFFLKYVGNGIAEEVSKLYISIKQDINLKNYFPDLIAYEKGWLIYECVEGQDFFKFFIRSLFNRSFEKALELLFLQGNCLAAYHRSFVKDFVQAKDYLEPYFSQLNSSYSHADLMDELPVVKLYNGFTMRNILLIGSKKFLCLDIDGAFHPKLPQYMLPYHDISISILNILSLSTFPFLPYFRIKKAIYEFLKGYFYKHPYLRYSKFFLQTIIEFQYQGLTGLSIKDIYPSMKHIIFMKRISTAIKKNKFSFLPLTINE